MRGHPFYVSEEGARDLFDAVRRDDVEAVRSTLREKPHLVHERDALNNSLLHYARSPQMVRLLVEFGADINAAGFNGATPVMRYAAAGCIECVKTAVALGARIDITDDLGRNLLFYAAEGGLDVYSFVASLGVESRPDKIGLTPEALARPLTI